MRDFSKIQSDIDQKKEQIATLNNRLKEAKYATVTDGVGKSIGAIIWGMFAAPMAFIIAGSWYYAKVNTQALIIEGIFFLLFFIMCLRKTIQYLSASMRYPAALGVLIFSGIMFLETVSTIWFFYAKKDTVIQFLGGTAAFIEKMGINYDKFFQAVLIGTGIQLIPVLLVLIGSLVKYLKQLKEKKDCERQKIELADAVTLENENLAALKKELADVKKEATQIFRAECKSPEPNAERIQMVADLGLDDAKEWISAQKKEKSKQKGEEIFKQEIQEPKPDIDKMKKAARLGSADAALWVAARIAITYFPDLASYADAELREMADDLDTFVHSAEGCGNADLFYVVKGLSSLANFAYGQKYSERQTVDEMVGKLKKLRGMKEKEIFQNEELRLLDTAIEKYVASVDALEEQERQRYKEREKEKSREATRSYTPIRCRYDACGVCTKRSTAYTKINCYHSGSDQLTCSDFSAR